MRPIRPRPAVARALASAILAFGAALTLLPPKASAAGCVRPVDNLEVTSSTTFCPSTYTVADTGGDGVIIVKGSNIVLDGTGVILQGKGYKGAGITLNGQDGVTIKGFAISGYYYGMRLENAGGLTVQGNKAWNNYTNKGRFLNINAPVSSAYGGGILLNGVLGSTISDNVLTGQSSGLDLYASNNNQIRNNDASSNSAWGIKLHSSDGNTIVGNQGHHVNRTGDRGFDSAGILLTQGSDANLVDGNNLTYSGDGFFIGNQHSTPSTNNTIQNNDGSYSPNNCFEATFGTNNRFVNNKAVGCNYGFWLGYSVGSYLENNLVTGNRTDGVNIDRGASATLAGNTIDGNGRHGVAFTELSSGMASPPRSTGHAVSGNRIRDNASAGVYLQDTTRTTLASNLIAGNANGLYLTGGSTGLAASQNNLVCTSASGKACQTNAYNAMAAGAVAENNWWGTKEPGAIGALIKGAVDYDPYLTAPSPGAPAP